MVGRYGYGKEDERKKRMNEKFNDEINFTLNAGHEKILLLMLFL